MPNSGYNSIILLKQEKKQKVKLHNIKVATVYGVEVNKEGFGDLGEHQLIWQSGYHVGGKMPRTVIPSFLWET